MPIYNVSAPAGALRADAKQRIAAAITDVHCKVTGAQPKLVNVYVREFADEDVFVAGQPSRQYLVLGLIRQGRDDASQHAILAGISRAIADIAGVEEAKIGVALQDIDESHAMEGGHTLPKASSANGGRR